MLKVDYEGPILRLTLNRPEVRNAFNDELIAALDETFANLPADVRAVVIGGEGPVFCAGGDLNWMRKAAAYSEEQNVQDALRLSTLLRRVAECPAVVIARVHGAAFGGGCGLTAAADIALAVDGTRFAFSEVKLGLVPATIASVVIPKIGAGHSRALFVTGEAFDAAHAFRIGLIHFVGTAAEVDAMLDKKLDAVLAAGPEAVSEAKRLAQRPPLDPEGSARLLARVRSQKEAQQGIAAFLGKHPAPFVVKR